MMRQIEERLYFAYGANINRALMHLKCGNPQVLGIARLEGHRVDFFGYSRTWDGAVETVIPDSQSAVWGVLYRLEAYDWERLDNCEDARADGTGEYFHYPVEVSVDGEAPVAATIYKKARLGQPEIPSTQYLNVILEGAREQGLPDEYVAALAAVPAKPAAYPVPRRPSYERVGQGGCDGCSGCEE